MSTPVRPCECLICQQNVVHVRAKGMTATDLAAEHAQKQRPKSFEDIVPEHYRDFKDVFDKKDFDRLPDRKPCRKLNDLTIKNRYPLPLISEMINLLKNTIYFTKFDVQWGFNNIQV